MESGSEYTSILSGFVPENDHEREWLDIALELEREVMESAQEDYVILPETAEAFEKWSLKETQREIIAKKHLDMQSPEFRGEMIGRRKGVYSDQWFKKCPRDLIKHLNTEMINADQIVKDFHYYYDSLKNAHIPLVYHFVVNSFIFGYPLPLIWITIRAELRKRKVPIEFKYRDMKSFINNDIIKKRDEYRKSYQDMKLQLFADHYRERFESEDRFIKIQIKAINGYLDQLEKIDAVKDEERFNFLSKRIKALQRSIDSVHGIEKMRDAMIGVAAEQAKKTIANSFEATGANTPQKMVGTVIDFQIESDSKSGGVLLDLPPVLDVDISSTDAAFNAIE
jgi:plasmid maintenance system killer protein